MDAEELVAAIRERHYDCSAHGEAPYCGTCSHEQDAIWMPCPPAIAADRIEAALATNNYEDYYDGGAKAALDGHDVRAVDAPDGGDQ